MYFGNFRNYPSLRRRAYEKDEGPPCRRSLGEATDRQGAGDTTGRERFDDNVSV